MMLPRCWRLLVAALCLFFVASPVVRVDALDGEFERALRISSPARPSDPIPRLVHFVYGLRSGTPGFDFFQYLSVKSAYENIRPDAIWLWIHNEPEGEWWDKAKELVTVKHIDGIDSVYGIPVAHFAHRADILRLKVLHDHGGIYLDLDVLVLKSFDDLLVDHSFVMGQEGVDGAIGLCNAVLISQPRAPFLRRWMESYRTFDGVVWAWHSVAIPGHLSAVYPSEITVLNHTAFFWPLWNEAGLQKLYLEKSHDFSNSYAVHLWESNARHWFLNQLTPELAENIDLPIMCQVRRIMGTLAANDTTANCEPAKRNLYSDGTVALYTFDNDNISTRRIEDDLGNGLHGWALNGTELVMGHNERGQARYFRGMGDFATLPVPNTMNMEQFTVQLEIRFGDLCQSAASIMAIQSQDVVVLIEGTCSPPDRTLWLKAFRPRTGEEALVQMEAIALPKFAEGQWVTVAVRASAALKKIEMLVDNALSVSGPWPPQEEQWRHRTPVSNVWLGARPASPFPNPHRQEIMHDFRGAIDNVIVWDGFVQDSILTQAGRNPHGFFHRHRSLSAARNSPVLVANVEMASFEADSPVPQISWTNDSSVFTPTYPPKLPISLREALPLNTPAWTVSWVMDYKEAFVPEREVGSKTVLDDPYLDIKFDSGQSLAVTHDLATGTLAIKQWGFGYPTVMPVSKQFACHRSVGSGISVHLSLSFDSESGDVSLFCSGVRIFVRRLERTLAGKGPRIASVSESSPPTRIQLLPSIPAEQDRIALAQSMLERKPAFAAEVAKTLIPVPSGATRTERFILPNETFIEGDLQLSLDRSLHLNRLSAALHMAESEGAYFMGVPVVHVEQKGPNEFTLSSAHLACAGRPTAQVELVLPELFARFAWSIHCHAPEDTVHDFASTWVAASVDRVHSHYLEVLGLCVALGAIYALMVRSTRRSQKWTAASDEKAALAGSEDKRSSPTNAPRFKLKTFVTFGLAAVALLGLHMLWTADSELTRLRSGSYNNNETVWPATVPAHQNVTSLQLKHHPPLATISPHHALSHGRTDQPIAFSVITPCYMQAQYIAEAGRSLSEQTFRHFEWIIVDDGSPDQCYLTAQKLRDTYKMLPIRVIRKTNSGLAGTRNFAIEAAKSDWICLLDADDRIDPTYLEKAAEAIQNQRTLTAINSDQQFFGDSTWLWDLPEFSKTTMLYKGLFPVQTIFRRQDWARIGGFEPTLPWGNEDWSFWVGLSHLDDFAVKKLPGSLLKYRYKETSMQREKQLYPEVYWMMMTLHWDKYTPNEIKLAHELIGRWGAPETVALVKKLLAKHPSRRAPHLWLGIFAEERGDLTEALAHYQRSVDTRPEGSTDWQAEYRMTVVAKKQKTPNSYLGM